MTDKLDKVHGLLAELQGILLRERPDSYWCRGIGNLVQYIDEGKKVEADRRKMLMTVKQELSAMYAPKEGGLGDFYVYREDFEEMLLENNMLDRIQNDIAGCLG